MTELNPRQLRNLKDKISQARIRLRAAERNLAAARRARNTDQIEALARTVRTIREERDGLIRQLTGADPVPTPRGRHARSGRREW